MTLGNLLPGLLDDRLSHSEQAVGVSIALTAGGASFIGALAALFTFAPFRRGFEAQARSQRAATAGGG